MKMRNKGKVHPSPSSSSASPSSPASFSATNKDILSVLKLLPAAILTLVSVLSLQDKEVLAYMITRSLKTTINPFNILEEKSKKKSTHISKNNNIVAHKPPMFDCECFDCYTSYWSKWNSSSNRELIHQAIEAFEEHLNRNNGEISSSSSKNKGRNKKREKMSRRGGGKIQENGSENQESSPENQESPEIGVFCNGSPEIGIFCDGSPVNREVEVVEEMEVEVAPPVSTVATAAGCGSSHKGLARKVLPDLLGLFNSRLWSLWGPNV